MLVGCIFSPSDGCCFFSTITKKIRIGKHIFPKFTFFPLWNKPSPRHIACISPLEASCAQESHGPTTWEVGTGAETSISTPHFAFRRLTMAGWYQNGGSVYVFSPSDDTYDTGNFWWCDTFTFGSMFGWTLFWASFSGDTVFYQGFNDVFLTSKWKTFMTGWWWCYDYITNIMIIMYLLIDAIWHLIWLCSLILSDDFDLINRHKKYNTSLLGLLTKRGTVPGGQVNLELQFSKCWY